MTRTRNLIAAMALMGVATIGTARAADPPSVEPGQLAGNTLSAVVYAQPPTVGAGRGLRRIVLQAYLATDGTTVLRQWLPERDRYSPPQRTRWSLVQNRLCLDLPPDSAETTAAPPLHDRPLCAAIHLWWPRIAGIGIDPYAMLDGDLQPGNVVGRTPARSTPR